MTRRKSLMPSRGAGGRVRARPGGGPESVAPGRAAVGDPRGGSPANSGGAGLATGARKGSRCDAPAAQATGRRAVEGGGAGDAAKSEERLGRGGGGRQVPRIADSLRPCFRISYEQRPRLATLAAHVTWSSMDVAVKLEDVHPSSSTSLMDKPIFEVW
eukprot:s144_g3.t1